MMKNFKQSSSSCLWACAFTGLTAGFFNSLVNADTTLYRNAQVYTMSPNQPWAEAVVIKDEHIAYVGDEQGAKKYLDKNNQTIDVKGKLMLPGLIETHAHPVFGSVLASGLVFDMEEPSIENYLQQVRQYLDENPKAEVIFGFGFYADSFGELGPLKSQLDKLDDQRPIVFLDDGGHSAWANSKAYELAGIDRHTPDPEPGVHFYRRDKNGEPTGHALETQAVEPLLTAIGVYSQDNVHKQLLKTMPLFPMLGYTTVYDAGMLNTTDIGHRALRALEDAGRLHTRLFTSVSLLDPKKAKDAVTDLQALKKKYSSKLVHPTTLKIHNDGTTEAETSAQLKPYLNDHNNYGGLILEGEALANVVTEVDRAGFNIHIHSIGDKAVREALNAFEVARKENPNSQNRFSTAHTELVSAQDIPRFAELDVVAQTTPLWFGMERDHAHRVLGKDRAQRLYSFGAMARSGAKITFGSDFPVSGGVPGLVAMAHIESGMTRAFPGAPLGQAQPQGDSVFSLDAMLRGYTIDAAYQLNMEKQLGSIEVGKTADLVIMRDNLFEMVPQKIHKAKVQTTILNGKVVYQRQPGVETLEKELGI